MISVLGQPFQDLISIIRFSCMHFCMWLISGFTTVEANSCYKNLQCVTNIVGALGSRPQIQSTGFGEATHLYYW